MANTLCFRLAAINSFLKPSGNAITCQGSDWVQRNKNFYDGLHMTLKIHVLQNFNCDDINSVAKVTGILMWRVFGGVGIFGRALRLDEVIWNPCEGIGM